MLSIADQWIPAQVVNSKRVEGIDLALLEIPGEIPLLRCLPVAHVPLSPHGVVYMAGYPHGGQVRVTEGQIVPTEYLRITRCRSTSVRSKAKAAGRS